MAGCLLKGELKTIEQVMAALQNNVDFFWTKLGMHLTYLKAKYNEAKKLYEVECYFGS